MRKNLSLSIVLAAALGCSALAFAAPGGQDAGGPGFGGHAGHGWHGGDHGGRAGLGQLRKLDLSDAQKASIKQLAQQNFAQLRPQLQAVRQQRQALEALTPDAAGYQQAAAQLAQSEASLTSARIIQRAALTTRVYALLTTAQKSQLASDKAQRLARIEQWKQFKSEHPTPAAAPAGQ